MPNENKRIFVGGLSETVTEEELISKFKKFGDVKSVQVKTKRDALGRPPNTFAFINIHLTPDSLHTCFTTLGNTKWKGSYLRLEVAKENFLDRLKRERENQVSSSNGMGISEAGRQSFDKGIHTSTKQHYKPRTELKHTIPNRRQEGELPPFKGFTFSGKGDFDHLFETSEENANTFICPRHERKRKRAISPSEHLKAKNKYKPSDDLMNRMESFSSMWKDDYVPQSPAVDKIEEEPTVEEKPTAEEEPAAVDHSDVDHSDVEDRESAFQARVTSYLRFDPTRKDHQKYILSPSKKRKKKSTKEVVEATEDEEVHQEECAPNDKFYKVAEDLKSRFEGKKNQSADGSFSLLAALGSQPQPQGTEDEDPVEQFEENWEAWEDSSYTNYEEYGGYSKKNSLLIVAGDPRLQEGIAFISNKPDRKEMLAKWREQKRMLKILCKKKHSDALREDRGVKLLRGTNRGFPGRGRAKGRNKRF